MEVWAAWAGALVAAIAAGITLWTRWRDRPEVVWHFGLDGLQLSVERAQPLKRDGYMPHRIVRVTNAGDGNAHAVSVTGDNIAAQLLDLEAQGDPRGFATPEVAGWVNPNAHLLVAVWVNSVDGGDGSRIVDGDAVLRVEWTEGPVKHRRDRSQALVLLGDNPGPRPPERIKSRTVTGLAE